LTSGMAVKACYFIELKNAIDKMGQTDSACFSTNWTGIWNNVGVGSPLSVSVLDELESNVNTLYTGLQLGSANWISVQSPNPLPFSRLTDLRSAVAAAAAKSCPVSCAPTGAWTNGSCGDGASACGSLTCALGQMCQTAVYNPANCQSPPATQCVADPTNCPACTPGSWTSAAVNEYDAAGCGANGCMTQQLSETRTWSPSGCHTSGDTETRCLTSDHCKTMATGDPSECPPYTQLGGNCSSPRPPCCTGLYTCDSTLHVCGYPVCSAAGQGCNSAASDWVSCCAGLYCNGSHTCQ
jgi:hypothetical protein